MDARHLDGERMGFPVWTLQDQFDPASRARIMRFLRQLRQLEWLAEQPRTALRRVQLAVLWRVHMRNAAMLGFTIPPGVCGPGLWIAHIGTIVINQHAKIGVRCRIHPGVLVGTTADGAPTIGDDVYLGNGAKVIGPVRIGDWAVIGAGAVVLHDVPDHCLAVGNPARIAKRNLPETARD